MKNCAKVLVSLTMLILALPAWAAPKSTRWTGAEDSNADLAHITEKIRAQTGYDLKVEDLQLIEDRDLANNHFKMYFQTTDGMPVRQRSVRVWTRLGSPNVAVQVEAYLDDPAKLLKTLARREKMGLFTNELISGFSKTRTMRLVRKAIQDKARETLDAAITDVSWSDQWENDELVRVVKAKSRRGYHQIVISLDRGKVLSTGYDEFPQSDATGGEQSLPALVYPIYEQADSVNHLQARVRAELKYLRSTVSLITADPYANLRDRKYPEAKMDPVLGETVAGREKGFWAMSYIKRQAASLRQALPTVSNDFSRGLVLEGRFATINLHPNAREKYTGLKFELHPSAQFKPDWRTTLVDGNEVSEMVPSAALLGRPLFSADEGLTRVARRLPDHNPVEYINDGFDELQVYYAINTLFDSLHGMGFSDPELSTRPFNAFLYDPDISMRDNAFYTDDTINFTTYSANAPNYARDNSTIWHELGHGVMDRLMGDYIQLADTGGLSEGMADFVAALVIADVTKGVPFEGSDKFRIINKTGFFLTNEVHDDGEAYGGAMKDLLDAAVTKFGQAGVTKVTDVTLEAMRLCRNHPALTAQEWFGHMLFADELGHDGLRTPGELRATILSALAGRNFAPNGAVPASYSLKNGNDEVTGSSLGSRRRPILVELPVTGKATYHLTVSLKSSTQYHFEYPVKVRVFLRTGPLQGAIHWDGEEHTSLDYTLASETDTLPVDLTANGKCDEVNRDDGSCVDYAYIQIFNHGNDARPVAKKRFYLRVKTK